MTTEAAIVLAFGLLLVALMPSGDVQIAAAVVWIVGFGARCLLDELRAEDDEP